jgi:two-component system, OmpR family, phosphate regulon sensor histidine kinase PhoR
VWNELKQNLSSARVYLKEFLFFNAFIIIFIIEVVNSQSLSLPLIFLSVLLSIVFLNFIGSKRNKELNEIKALISNIRNNVYSNSADIRLSKYLTGLQEEIKLMFEKTRNDIDYLKKLERMRTEFLANVSHELRTPIFAIQGYIETLLNGALNDPKVNNSFLEKANLHTINLSNLLNDLIDISMIESGEMRMSYRYFNLNEYLEPLVKELSLMAEEKNLELIYHPAKVGLLVFGDKNKLRQVFVNLVQNSIKYTETGKVEILTEEEPKHARVIIRDTGIGIPEEDLARIFERFYRVDKARSRAVGGTGLGLAIVKHIVEAHGSKIEVKSKLDSGSEFSFKLKK